MPTSPALDFASSPLSAQRPLGVLVVDTNPVNRLLWSQMLRRLGHAPQAVADAKEAFTAAQTADFDVVLMDLHLPTADGTEVARKLRAMAGSPDQLWIIASANSADSEDYDRAMASGMNDFVVKSGHFENLTRAMRFAEQALRERFATDQHAA